MIQGVVFDLFNTLIYEKREQIRWWEASKLLGLNLDKYDTLKVWEQIFCTHLYSDFREPLTTLRKKLANPVSDEAFEKSLQVMNNFDEKTFQMFDDVRPVLRALKGKYKLGLLTNVTAPDYAVARKKFKLNDIFDAIGASCQIEVIKPDKRAFVAILHALNLNRDQIIFVGDSFRDDCRGAENAGLNAVMIDRFSKHTEFEKRIEKLQELSRFLK